MSFAERLKNSNAMWTLLVAAAEDDNQQPQAFSVADQL
jgi:hypothetical protein